MSYQDQCHPCGRPKRALILRNVFACVKQGFMVSETYFTSLGLNPLLYDKIVVEQHSDRVVEAHLARREV